ncbi:MAG: succinate dehydrogenase assembly factor 2 [Pseudomonadales bacterium]
MSGHEQPDAAASGDKRLYWRSRRGMLELELALLPFLEHRLEALSSQERALYGRLLQHEDWDIYDWIMGKATPPDAELVRIIEHIRAANQAGSAR